MTADGLRGSPQKGPSLQGHSRTLGHPVPSILDAIEASGAEIWRTDERGTVTVVFGPDGPVASGTR